MIRRDGQRVHKPKLVAVVGPTCSGKSELGVQLARKFNGEVVSADSRQVYRGLDLSSSKVAGKWQRYGLRQQFVYKGIIHHLIDVAPLRKQFTVQKFRQKAKRAISSIYRRRHLPIVVGGTGFYVDALLYDLALPKVPPNRRLRKNLEALNAKELINRLRGLDPQRAREIDPNNKQRLVRAIEIVVATGSPVPIIRPRDFSDSPYQVLKIGLRVEDEQLRIKIGKVVDRRIEEGALGEIERLHRKGASWGRFEELGMEYKLMTDYLKTNLTIENLKKAMKREYWHYAKRQTTWFSKDKNTIWVDDPAKAFQLVQDFLGREA